jgi:predicted aldo/keto reductase-like oxidoreductase
MQYRTDKKSGNELSALGFGCMRFPKVLTQIDMKKTERLIMKAVENGVNYFDCAYIYNGSEETLGTILEKNNARDKVYIATKLPLMKCNTADDFDKLFETQLKKLRTDHIDYYLMHNLSDLQLWKDLCGLGIEKWIAEKKAGGQIKQVGFSFHGTQNEFMALLDAYDWDFCQIQYNYININYQAGLAGLRKAAEMGLSVIVMEPLLGGKLATGLPKKAKELFSSVNENLSPAAWALRWLWNQPEVTVVLSGMNDDSQLDENLVIAGESSPDMFTQQENDVFLSVAEAFNAFYKIPCTGCNYCMPCPANVNIPGCFAAYNLSFAVGKISAIMQYATSTGGFSPQKNYSASQCIKCGSCEKKCPQHIKIPIELENVKKRMEPFWYRAIKAIMTSRRATK